MSETALAGRRRTELTDGWELAASAPGACESPCETDRLDWRTARVPGTAAGAVGDSGQDFDASDWWFRVSFASDPVAPGEEVMLNLEGVATVAEVYLNGERLLSSESMFLKHELDVGRLLADRNELAICCRALTPRLAARRRPRARWRTRLAAANLRFYRTMLLGRAPGFAPGPAVVGPWAPVSLERRHGVMLEMARLRPRVRGDAGALSCTATVRALPGAELPSGLVMSAVGATGRHEAELRVVPEGGERAGTAGLLVVPEVELWWPHTHGTPTLWEVEVSDPASGEALHRARVGFRTLQSAPDLAADGPALRINGEPVFARGAVWTPTSLEAPVGPPGELQRILEAVVAGGMNMLRVPGTGAYEGEHFYDMCDALGILVWQDFMFANLDYPESDPAFMTLVHREASELLHRLGGRPSLAVLCGGSEVAQQVAMLGLDPALAAGPLYGELLPSAVAEAEVEAPYVPSAPWGGDLPFRTDKGVANYYGVGAYLRPLSDARLADVRFASECLAFANVPDEDGLAALASAGDPAVGGATWKSGVPRDVGAGWDFEDVRDHYLKRLFELDPVALRSSDPERYLDLSRAVSGEVMAETFGEWRRAGSPCRGALVLWLKDLLPGAGWGLLDHRGEPKVAYHHLRRALAPLAVWSTDEGLGGIAVHVANDGPTAVHGRVRVALYRDFEVLVAEAAVDVELGAHGAWEGNVESMLGHFVDVNWAYRFGAPAQDLIALSLERDGELISQAFRFPVGRPLAPAPEARLGLRGRARRERAGGAVRVSSETFAHGVRLRVAGYVPRDDAFGVEPGHERVIELVAVGEPPWPPAEATLTALNLSGRVRIEIDER